MNQALQNLLSASLPTSRRGMLQRAAAGFGMLGLAGLLEREASGSFLAPGANLQRDTDQRPLGQQHFAARAKRVIFLFMNGGPSHVDTFDPKPALKKFEGDVPSEKTKRKKAGYLPSPFRFRPQGDSGVVMSELFPRLASVADELAVIRSMYADEPNHEPGLLLMNSGNQQPIRPSIGSWASYGLGSENENLPGFVVLCPGRPVVGPRLWSSGFLPAKHQGMSLDTNQTKVEQLIPNLENVDLSRNDQRRQLDLLQELNRIHLQKSNSESALEAQIQSYELAFQMQKSAADVFDLAQESKETRESYGNTPFGRSCLMARRMAEAGVRFTQVYYVNQKNKQPWDTHKDNAGGHRRLCADADRATAALIADLKQRGLLEDTLVIWGGEFGRTPFAQIDKNKKAKPGRDHHSDAFSMLLAGGGVRGGVMHGETDEFGMHAVKNRVHVHDLHATILHLMGIDHERLTYRYSGRDFRLTDVHGRVIDSILA